MTAKSHRLMCEYLIKATAALAMAQYPTETSPEVLEQAYRDAINDATQALIKAGIIACPQPGVFHFIGDREQIL